MRTLIFILAGFVLLAASLGVARLSGGSAAAGMRSAVWIFIAIWFLVAVVNLWMGVARAGYSVGEELPIFLLIFLLPAAAAVLIRWRFL